MKVSPALRAACHLALDTVLDALDAEATGAPKVKKRRGPVGNRVPPIDLATARPELVEQVDRQMAKAGYRKREG